MNYQQTLDFLFSRLPMFTRIGAVAYKKDLHNTIAFCENLGNPQNKFKSIHVAGTNGKGSTSHMLASILQAQGYKTGLYTSPHLKDFRERIRINGEMISEAEVVNFVDENKNLIETIEPSFFEATVAMAFNHFAKHQVDIAIIEVGLGGRLDSTNIINPLLSVITNISLDHTNMLGNTLPEIAFEKAGIIKSNTPVVIGETHVESKPVFINKAEKENAPIIFADQQLFTSNISVDSKYLNLTVANQTNVIFDKLNCDLLGLYQEKNIKTVLTAIFELKKYSNFKIDDDKILEGLANVKSNTNLLGRWHTLKTKPLTICDTGHNEAGITEVLKNINVTPFEKLHIVFGMVKDKDISHVLALMPKNATYYFCSPNLERGLPAVELQTLANQFNLTGDIYSSVLEARKTAENNANPNDLIFIGGSTFVVAEII